MSDVPIDDVVARLESGEAPARVAEATGLAGLDLVAALAHAALGDDGALGPTLEQSAPAHPRLASALSETVWVDLFPRSNRPARLALAAGLLQVHDFWDASHHAAQQADDLGESHVSAYWHAIAHRREPDPGNASYWFRRVGRHPVFALLAKQARPLLDEYGDAALTSRLLSGGSWEPYAFVDLATKRRSSDAMTDLARKLQRLEMILLLEATCVWL
jgi:hypothetical protein